MLARTTTSEASAATTTIVGSVGKDFHLKVDRLIRDAAQRREMSANAREFALTRRWKVVFDRGCFHSFPEPEEQRLFVERVRDRLVDGGLRLGADPRW